VPIVRLLSYNVRSLRDDTDALIRVVRGCRPDLVCLQEAPRFGLWRTRRRSFARSCDLTVAAGGRTAGLAVLAGARARVLHREHHLLSRVPKLHRRGLVMAVTELEGARLIVASTHLDLAPAARRAHAAEIIELLGRARERYGAPVILAGDINEAPGGPAWELLGRAFRDAHVIAPSGGGETFPAARPRHRLDAVFTDPRIDVIRCGVPADLCLSRDYAKATDHRPVVGELDFRP
jgi:endonuclease/exonuclease/phosphatase family metal-dependent hydrolase